MGDNQFDFGMDDLLLSQSSIRRIGDESTVKILETLLLTIASLR